MLRRSHRVDHPRAGGVGNLEVRIRPSREAIADGGFLEDVALYYLATPKSLVVTLNKDVIKRAVERSVARREKDSQEDKPTAEKT